MKGLACNLKHRRNSAQGANASPVKCPRVGVLPRQEGERSLLNMEASTTHTRTNKEPGASGGPPLAQKRPGDKPAPQTQTWGKRLACKLQHRRPPPPPPQNGRSASREPASAMSLLASLLWQPPDWVPFVTAGFSTFVGILAELGGGKFTQFIYLLLI